MGTVTPIKVKMSPDDLVNHVYGDLDYVTVRLDAVGLKDQNKVSWADIFDGINVDADVLAKSRDIVDRKNEASTYERQAKGDNTSLQSGILQSRYCRVTMVNMIITGAMMTIRKQLVALPESLSRLVPEAGRAEYVQESAQAIKDMLADTTKIICKEVEREQRKARESQEKLLKTTG